MKYGRAMAVCALLASGMMLSSCESKGQKTLRKLDYLCKTKAYMEIKNRELWDEFGQRQIAVAKKIDPEAVSRGYTQINPYPESGPEYHWKLISPKWYTDKKSEDREYIIFPDAFILYYNDEIILISHGYEVYFHEALSSNAGFCHDSKARIYLKGKAHE